MDRNYIRNNKWLIAFLIVLLVGFIVFVIVENQHEEAESERLMKWSEQKREEEDQKRQKMKLTYVSEKVDEIDRIGYSVFDIKNNVCDADILLKPDDFKNSYFSSAYKGGTARISFQKDVNCNESDILILQFVAYTAQKAGKLSINCGSVKNDIYVTTTPYEYYIPISNVTEIDDINISLLTDYQNTYISDMYLINYGDTYKINELTTGSYNLGKYKIIDINAENSEFGKCNSAVLNDQLLYTINAGNLTIYQLRDEAEPFVLSKLSGLGDTRNLAFANNNKSLVITSRRNGVYIVDITDSTNPYIISHYDSLEYATGLCVEGNYAFICSRYFGVEIVDISDLFNPKYVTKLSNETEYQNCYFSNGYLYIGVYRDKRVDIWDIHEINNPQKITQIELDGSGQGLFVSGDYLYAATALNSSNTANYLTDYGCGTGNGLEIYDISDLDNVTWLSTIKMDGRYNYNGMDTWDVVVSNDLAYVSSMGNGVYIVKVAKADSPEIVSHITVNASKDSSNYHGYDTSKYVFPFDTDEETKACFYHTILSDNKAYLISPDMGIFTYSSSDITKVTKNKAFNFRLDEKKEDFTEFNEFDVTQYQCDGQVWAVDHIEGFYALACGDEGIQLIDENLNFITSYQTDSAVHDIAVYGKYIYTAETDSGLSIYKLSDDNEFIKISSFVPQNYDDCFGSLELTHDGKFIVIEASFNSYYVLDVSDVYSPIELKEFENIDLGLMYYRSICNGLVDGKYIGIFGSKNYAWFYSDNGKFKMLESGTHDFVSEVNGAASYGEYCLSLYQNGYVYYYPKSSEFSEKIKIDGVRFEGKLSIWNDVLVISREYSGDLIFVDITNIDHPTLLADYSISGNPDIAYTGTDFILLPCRHQGLFKIQKVS